MSQTRAQTAASRVGNSLAEILVQVLRERAGHEASPRRFSQRIGISRTILDCPWFQDIPALCSGAHLELGIVVRNRKGGEVYFWGEGGLEDQDEAQGQPVGEQPVGVRLKDLQYLDDAEEQPLSQEEDDDENLLDCEVPLNQFDLDDEAEAKYESRPLEQQRLLSHDQEE